MATNSSLPKTEANPLAPPSTLFERVPSLISSDSITSPDSSSLIPSDSITSPDSSSLIPSDSIATANSSSLISPGSITTTNSSTSLVGTGGLVLVTGINPCRSNNGGCDKRANCSNNNNGSRTCKCPSGYESKPKNATHEACTDIDECKVYQNGLCPNNLTCVNAEGGRLCTCPDGYNVSSSANVSNDYICVDFNECLIANGGKGGGFGGCHRSATCVNEPGSRKCLCNRGYTGLGIGPDGCKDIDECAIDNGGCSDGLICYNRPGSRYCACNYEFQTGREVGFHPCYPFNERNCQTERGSMIRGDSYDGYYEMRKDDGMRKKRQTGYMGEDYFRPCTENAVCRTMSGNESRLYGGKYCVEDLEDRKDPCYDCFCLPGFVGDGWNYCNEKPREKSWLKFYGVSDPVTVIESINSDVRAEFDCAAGGFPTPNVEWIRNGMVLNETRMKISRGESFTNGSLVVTSNIIIHNVRFSDAGSYSCRVVNKAGTETKETSLKVTKKLVFQKRPSDVVVVPGGTTTLDCVVEHDDIFESLLSWSFNGSVILEKVGVNSLPLKIAKADPKEAGVYICEAKTRRKQNRETPSSRSTDAIISRPKEAKAISNFPFLQKKISRATLRILYDACLLDPCLNGGTCESVVSLDVRKYRCECNEGFYGKRCQFYDRTIYGLRGATIFDNSQDASHELDVSCSFGSHARYYKISQIFPDGTKTSMTKGQKFTKRLKAPEREGAGDKDTDNLSFLECKAMIGKNEISDKKQIRFYEFHNHGEMATYEVENDDAKWYVNGELEEDERKAFHKKWTETPGIKQKVVAKVRPGALAKSWDIIVCGYNKRQTAILGFSCLAIVATFALFIVVMRLSKDFTLTLKKKAKAGEKKKKSLTLIAKLKKSITIKIFTFVSNLHIIDILVGLGFYYRRDIWWAAITFGIIAIAWFIRFISFYTFILCRKKTGECDDIYRTIKRKGVLKIIILVFFNQAEQLLEDDLEKSDSLQDAQGRKRKKSALQYFQCLSALETLAMLILSAHIMTELLGSEHMCFPPSITLSKPDFRYFDDAEFTRFSLTSIIPEKEDYLMENEPVKNTSFIDSGDIFSRVGACKKNVPCRCKKWVMNIDGCLPSHILDYKLLNSDIKCFVSDCYQNPCIIFLILPLIQFFLSTLKLGYTLTKKVNRKPAHVALYPIRFLYIIWSIAGLLFVTLYVSDTFQSILKVKSYKGIIALVCIIIFRIITPNTAAQLFKKNLRKKVFLAWFCLGSVLSFLFFLLPFFILFLFRGCDENAKNRVTFHVNEFEELYVMPLRHYWDGVIEHIYLKDFNVKFEASVNPNRPYFNVRYDHNFITFAFKFIGYLAIVELFLTLFHNILSLLDYFVLEAKIQTKAANDARENVVDDDYVRRNRVTETSSISYRPDRSMTNNKEYDVDIDDGGETNEYFYLENVGNGQVEIVGNGQVENEAYYSVPSQDGINEERGETGENGDGDGIYSEITLENEPIKQYEPREKANVSANVPSLEAETEIGYYLNPVNE